MRSRVLILDYLWQQCTVYRGSDLITLLLMNKEVSKYSNQFPLILLLFPRHFLNTSKNILRKKLITKNEKFDIHL